MSTKAIIQSGCALLRDMYFWGLCVVLRCVLLEDMYRCEMCVVERCVLSWDVRCCEVVRYVLLWYVYSSDMCIVGWFVSSWDVHCSEIRMRCCETCIVVRCALLWDCEMSVVICVLLGDVNRCEMWVVVRYVLLWDVRFCEIVRCALLWAVYCREMWVVVRYVGPTVVRCGLRGVASRQLVVVYYKYVVSLNAYSYPWKKRTASNPNFVVVELLFLFIIWLGFSNTVNTVNFIFLNVRFIFRTRIGRWW